MRRFPLSAAALVLVAVAATPGQAAAAQRYETEHDSASQVVVGGTSTMHDWEATGDVIRGTLILNETDLSSLWRRASSPQKMIPTVYVEIPIESLKSGKSGLDKKMYETLKTQAHPVITYRLEATELRPGQNAREADMEEPIPIETKGVLTVAGKDRTVEIPMQIRRLPNSHLEVSGETTLRMTDFSINPPRLMMGVLRTGDEVHVRWKWVLVPSTDKQLPVKAEQLMPLESSESVYLAKEGPDKGKKVPVTLERRDDRWVLTQKGLMWHELQRDTQGNILILREADLRHNRQIEYNPPIILLPSQVDSNTSLTGKTQITIKSVRTGSVIDRGDCEWRLDFVGIQSVETLVGTFPAYHLKATRHIRLALVKTLVTVDFDYAFGKGIIATGIEQVDRFFSLFRSRTAWRLEQTGDSGAGRDL